MSDVGTGGASRAPLPPDFLRLPIAHRGLHDLARGRPENTLSAVRAAAEAGYGIEIDVQPSADGVPMVFHDHDLPRVTGRQGLVHDLTAAELGRIAVQGTSEHIPTLAEVVEEVAGRVPLLVEVKDLDGAMRDDVGPFEDRVATVLARATGPVAVMSFGPESVAALARAAPWLPRGLTTCAFEPADWPVLSPEVCRRLRGIPDAERVGASFISHEAADLGSPRVAELRAAGLSVLCWTIRSPAAEAEARRIAANVTFEGYAAAIPPADTGA
jgi:glycerophosphoryl diester phosphodiesterase